MPEFGGPHIFHLSHFPSLSDVVDAIVEFIPDKTQVYMLSVLTTISCIAPLVTSFVIVLAANKKNFVCCGSSCNLF